MENTAIIHQFIKALNVSLDDIEPSIKELIGESFEDKINTTSSPIDRIKTANGYAYILTSLCFTYLKSQGVDTNKHPIMQDLNRIKSYMKRATDASNPQKQPTIDTTAAKRFIQAALGNGIGNSTVINGTPEPAISSASFQGTHTKFNQHDSDDEERRTQKKEKSEKKKNLQSKGETLQSSEELSKVVGEKLRGQLKNKKSKSKSDKDKVSKKPKK